MTPLAYFMSSLANSDNLDPAFARAFAPTECDHEWFGERRMKALHVAHAAGHLSVAVEMLQAALKQSSAVEALILLPMIGRAAVLANDAKALITAMKEDSHEHA